MVVMRVYQPKERMYSGGYIVPVVTENSIALQRKHLPHV